MSQRPDGRRPEQLRPIEIELGVQNAPAGSVLIKWGGTHVLCSASIENRVPSFRMDSGGGWLTAEYAMLPGSTSHRIRRDRKGIGGRTAEIQRLIGRSLRAGFDLKRLGEHTINIDCDVLNADGGTRCAAITGSYIAAVMALKEIAHKDLVKLICPPPVAAVSVGIHQDQVVTDLCYIEDSAAEVDLNFVASTRGIIEVQGTAEGDPFERRLFDSLIDAGQAACTELFELQKRTLSEIGIEL